MGGVPEVLPNDMIHLAEPNVSCEQDLVHLIVTKVTALAEALDEAIEIRKSGHQLDMWEAHCRVKEMYNWYQIAERTEKVPIHCQWHHVNILETGLQHRC